MMDSAKNKRQEHRNSGAGVQGSSVTQRVPGTHEALGPILSTSLPLKKKKNLTGILETELKKILESNC